MKNVRSIVSLAFVTSLAVAQDYGTDKPPPTPEISIPLTAEQRASLHAVGVRLAAVEALAEKIDDPAYKAATVTAIADLKKRSKALEKNFDAGLYESLMHSVISRYQIVALWLAPARLPAPPVKPAAKSG
jgi:hypothetical protein